MTYQALYRQWRPQTFGEVVGQDHVVRTLVNALAAGRTSHAYLFCGPRGTGKTSTARILAKALNCLQDRAENVEPCNRCRNCLEISAGNSMDVQEIDAASHRGIDEIRELREKIRFFPSSCRVRVYIIDEVHMLTNEAFNALLKTLEEPPDHVVFILATTEPHRVPLTILSRCQRFDFRPLGIDVVVGRLEEVAAKSGFSVAKDALVAVARAAEGSLRDALSILDQAVALGGGRITAEDVHRILGTVKGEFLEDMMLSLTGGDARRALVLLNEACSEGKDPLLLVRELTAYLRNFLLVKMAPEIAYDVSVSNVHLSGRVDENRLVQVLEILTQAERDMRWSTQPRVVLELALLQASAGFSRADLEARLSRLEALLEGIAAGDAVRLPGSGEDAEPADEPEREGMAEISPGRDGGIVFPGASASTRSAGTVSEREAVGGGPVVEDSIPVGTGGAGEVKVDGEEGGRDDVRLQQVLNRWNEILEEVRRKGGPALFFYLNRAWPREVSGRVLTLAYEEEDSFLKENMERPENLLVLGRVLEKFFKGEWKVRCICCDDPSPVKRETGQAQEEFVKIADLFGGEEVEVPADDFFTSEPGNIRGEE